MNGNLHDLELAERLRQRAAASAKDYVQTWLTPLPEPAVLYPEVSKAYGYLEATHNSVDSLFELMRLTVESAALFSKNIPKDILDPRPLPDEGGQDQLRAAIVFTSAGIDACLKQLLRDILPLAIDASEKAGREFRKYLDGQLNRPVSRSMRLAILDKNPKARLIDLYVSARTKSSLQGSADLALVRATLGIPVQDIPDDRLARMDSFFTARNEIVHEMDFLSGDDCNAVGRRSRNWPAVIDECDEVLQLMGVFLVWVNENLCSKSEVS